MMENKNWTNIQAMAAAVGGIIDAHLHFVPHDAYFDEIAEKAGHENTGEHLSEQQNLLQISGGIVMGNRTLALNDHEYPDNLKYCIGLDSSVLKQCLTGNRPDTLSLRQAADQVERHLKRDSCAGIKLYPGYSPFYVYDRIYEPFYELAKLYKKPVAIHTGETAGSGALLRYGHPLTVDEAAASHPDVQFVMCHFGNPWLNDAAAVMSKNGNVAADLSGILEGAFDTGNLFREQSGYMEALRTWLQYINYRDVMFGTDWPLVNLKNYIEFIMALVPEKYYKSIFRENACRIYGL